MTPEQMNELLWSKMSAKNLVMNNGIIEKANKAEPVIEVKAEPIPSNVISLSSMIREINRQNNEELPPPMPHEAILVTAPIAAPAPKPMSQPQVKSSVRLPTWNDCKAMKAKYAGECRETGRTIMVDEWMLYDVANRCVYCKRSEVFNEYVEFLNLMAGAN